MISQSQECSERWLPSKPHVKYFSKSLMDTALVYCIYCPRLFSELSVSSHSLRSLFLPLTSRFRSLISLSWVGRTQHLLFILFYANKGFIQTHHKIEINEASLCQSLLSEGLVTLRESGGVDSRMAVEREGTFGGHSTLVYDSFLKVLDNVYPKIQNAIGFHSLYNTTYCSLA